MNRSADPSLQQGERVREHLPRGRRREAFRPSPSFSTRAAARHSSYTVQKGILGLQTRRGAKPSPLFVLTAMVLKRGEGCFSPSWRGQTPVNYTFVALFEPIFCLDERKILWYLCVFQKIEDRDVNETL